MSTALPRDSWSRITPRRRGRGDDGGSTREPLPINRDELETTLGFFASAALVYTVRFSERGTQEEGSRGAQGETAWTGVPMDVRTGSGVV
jgi:hypothetical protein